MSKLIIRRSSEWNNKMREIGLYLNGKKIGTIDDGEIKEFEVETGSYSLKAKIDWCGSETLNFTIDDAECKKVEVKGFKNAYWLMPLVLSTVFLGFILDYFFYFDIYALVTVVTLPALLYLIYFLTVGRNKYLRLILKE